jgi:hypothetical protein
LAQLDPDRAMRVAQIQALDDMARSGKIGWAEWAHRVRGVYLEPPEAAPEADKVDDLGEARAAAAEARTREQAETARQRSDERER